MKKFFTNRRDPLLPVEGHVRGRWILARRRSLLLALLLLRGHSLLGLHLGEHFLDLLFGLLRDRLALLGRKAHLLGARLRGGGELAELLLDTGVRRHEPV